MASTGRSDLVDVAGELRRETPKAFLIFDGSKEVWLPKSQRMRGEAYEDGKLPRLSTFAAEMRLLLELHVPGYRKPVCRFCGPVTHATRCAYPECPIVNPGARDFMHIDDIKKAASWPPKEDA
jgi:hypothetical protein